eukprot:CAMPEP_0168430982 /NCGR_PEP_ID=MMETSP0228-20121227/38151_1 /TAXON_ID=133427 /ORGANISM="Protoceratium reticulatum, Strain CCCM 535 (=CCMP 1889)" /LENGTH=150 /DNA_ID=CAMNT_0008445085 /DNA_START=380 /DNA_END=828 /DNA_ORIENTATION=+
MSGPQGLGFVFETSAMLVVPTQLNPIVCPYTLRPLPAVPGCCPPLTAAYVQLVVPRHAVGNSTFSLATQSAHTAVPSTQGFGFSPTTECALLVVPRMLAQGLGSSLETVHVQLAAPQPRAASGSYPSRSAGLRPRASRAADPCRRRRLRA